MGGRIQKSLYHPLQGSPLPLSKPPGLLSHPPKPLPSGLWGPSHEPPPLQPELQQSRAAALQPRAHGPLQSTGAESSCPAMVVSGRGHAQLGEGDAVPSARLPLPCPLSAAPWLYLPLCLHLSVVLLLGSCSCCQAVWGGEFQLQSHPLILWVLSCSCVHGNKCPSFHLWGCGQCRLWGWGRSWFSLS